MDELAGVISHDVGLSYKLLRYINCASFAFRREIDTVHEALVMIGTEMVKKWAILILNGFLRNLPPSQLGGGQSGLLQTGYRRR